MTNRDRQSIREQMRFHHAEAERHLSRADDLLHDLDDNENEGPGQVDLGFDKITTREGGNIECPADARGCPESVATNGPCVALVTGRNALDAHRRKQRSRDQERKRYFLAG